ncbi:MAG: hypothetical protein PHN82_11955 [bacterium]|nr:hypothetical protein [bacterium]
MHAALVAGAVAAILCEARPALARGLRLSEERILFSAPDGQGVVTVYAPPGTVEVPPNAIVTWLLENRKAKPRRPVQGAVAADGGFRARVAATPGDKLRLTLTSSVGGRKRLTRKVGPAPPPAAAMPAPRSPARPTQRTVPSPPATPDIVIRYKGTPAPERPAALPLDEVAASGVLPPD